MRRDTIEGLVILGLSLVGLWFVYFVNTSGTFDYLGDQLSGQGMGELCSSPQNCQEFCQSSRGRCQLYCQQNPTNSLCETL